MQLFQVNIPLPNTVANILTDGDFDAAGLNIVVDQITSDNQIRIYNTNGAGHLGQLDLNTDGTIDMGTGDVNINDGTGILTVKSGKYYSGVTALTLGTISPTDTSMFFNGSNDGRLDWNGATDEFIVYDDVLISTDEKIRFRDSGTKIWSSAIGTLEIYAQTNAALVNVTGAITASGDIQGLDGYFTGTVGIGTSPVATTGLIVEGGSTGGIVLNQNADSKGLQIFGYDDKSANNFNMYVNGSGSLVFDGSVGNILFNSLTSGRSVFFRAVGAGGIIMLDNSSGNAQLCNGGGRVGIGRAPGALYKLDVAGTFNADGAGLFGDTLNVTGVTTLSSGNIRAIVTQGTGTLTLDGTQYTVVLDASGGASVAQLDNTPVTGQVYNIKCEDDTNGASIDPQAKNIDASTTDISLSTHETITVQYDGTEWWII